MLKIHYFLFVSLICFSCVALVTSENCGFNYGGRYCSKNYCCSQKGECLSTFDGCGVGCQSGGCLPYPRLPFPISLRYPEEVWSSGAGGTGSNNSTGNNSTATERKLYSSLPVSKILYTAEGSAMSCSRSGAVAITYDDGPSQSYTPPVLAALKAKNITATFFVVGQMIQWAKELLLQTYNEKHQIASHSYSHVDFAILSQYQAQDELLNTETEIFNVIGKIPKYFRFPYGSTTNEMVKFVHSLGYISVQWNEDTLDFSWESQNKVMKTYQDALTPANMTSKSFIVLQHDINPTSAGVAPKMVDFVAKSGYLPVQIVTCLDGTDMYKPQKVAQTTANDFFAADAGNF